MTADLLLEASNSQKAEEYVLKFVLVGDSDVGKSQLVLRFSKDQFSQNPMQTVGMEFATRELSYCDNIHLKAQIWDTAGQDRPLSLTQAYYRGAVGAMLLYDVTNRESFDNVKKWLKQIKENSHRNIAISLIATKIDRTKDRVISAAEGLTFAEENGMDYVETSAVTGENVENAFRRQIMAVARLLPEGKRRNTETSSNCSAGKEEKLPKQQYAEFPPEGWILSKSKLRVGEASYENIWTGERVSECPCSSAVEYNTIQSRALTQSTDMTGIGIKDFDPPVQSNESSIDEAASSCAIS
jgi:small GTP-binding protein